MTADAMITESVIVGCQVREGGISCTGPVASWWAGACVHEHVTPRIGICAEHEWRAERPWTCTPCERSAGPHECFATVTRTGAPS